MKPRVAIHIHVSLSVFTSIYLLRFTLNQIHGHRNLLDFGELMKKLLIIYAYVGVARKCMHKCALSVSPPRRL